MRAGMTAAVLYSVVGTCKHLGIDPFGYLRGTLPANHVVGNKANQSGTSSVAYKQTSFPRDSPAPDRALLG
jgi:hypothetical protein